MNVTNGGVWLANHIYTILWVTRGKIPWLFADINIIVMDQLVDLVRAEVSPTAEAVPGYPQYDEAQNVTVWAVRVPVYETVSSPRIEEVYEKGILYFRSSNSPFYTLYEMVDMYYLELTGKTHTLPLAIYSPMQSGKIDDPIGLRDDDGGILQGIRDTLRDIFRPAKNVLTWGLVAVVGFGLFRAYKFVDRHTRGGK